MNASAKVREIYIGGEREGPMRDVSQVEAMVGKGLAGDRYAAGVGSYSKSRGIRDVTLIEVEALWDFYHLSGIDLHPSLTRRNLVTEGIRLVDLIGRSFSVGPVTLLGLRPCPPCQHLVRMVGMPEVLRGLARSGGIYAQIVSGGVLGVGDEILPLPGEVEVMA